MGQKKELDPQPAQEAEAGTIFDDVFRTIAQKMPFLLIPLINEVFGTEYSQEQEFEQLRNEHYERFGKVITDSIIRIGGAGAFPPVRRQGSGDFFSGVLCIIYPES